jgi:hypothetical protein
MCVCMCDACTAALKYYRYVCMHVCLYVCMHVCMYHCVKILQVCVYACVLVCMYACMYVCTAALKYYRYVTFCTHTHTQIKYHMNMLAHNFCVCVCGFARVVYDNERHMCVHNSTTVCMHVCMHVHTYICMLQTTGMWRRNDTGTDACIYAYMLVCTYVYMHIRMPAHT